MSLPRDFLEEVEMELDAARRSFARGGACAGALEELHSLAVAVRGDFRRPITIFDFIRSAPGREERERRLALVRRMRSPDTGAKMKAPRDDACA